MQGGIILLEGADASGKTTLAKVLRRAYNARYLHSTVRRNIWRWHLGALRYATRESLDRLVVLDRLHLSELVYGTVFRGGVGYGNVGLRCIDRVLRRFCCLTVLCVPSDQEAQLARWERGRAGGKREHFDRVLEVMDLYHTLTTNGYQDRDDVVVYDLDRHPEGDLPQVADGLLAQLGDLRESVPASTLDYRNYNRSGRAEVGQLATLFVGEKTSPRWRSGWPRWPWIDSDQVLSGATWFNRALDHLGLREDRMVMVNAIEADDQLPQLLEEREWTSIIALGLQAEARLMNLGMYSKVTTIPHPQHHRRFNYHDGHEGYANLIQEALA